MGIYSKKSVVNNQFGNFGWSLPPLCPAVDLGLGDGSVFRRFCSPRVRESHASRNDLWRRYCSPLSFSLPSQMSRQSAGSV